MGFYDTRPFPIVFINKYQILKCCIYQLFFTYLLSIFTVFLSEYPALTIEKVLFERKRKTRDNFEPGKKPLKYTVNGMRSLEIATG